MEDIVLLGNTANIKGYFNFFPRAGCFERVCYSHFIIRPISRLSDLQSAAVSVRPAALSALCVIGIDVNTLVPAQKAKYTNTSHHRSIHISILI